MSAFAPNGKRWISVVLFLHLANLAFAAEPGCSIFFGSLRSGESPSLRLSRESEKYYALDRKTRVSLEKFLSSAIQSGQARDGDQFSQSLRIKPITVSNWSVQFPRDKGKWTSINTHGGPYSEAGTLYIDFKIWNRDWAPGSFKHDRENALLRRMPFDDFYQLTQAGYRSSLKLKRNIVLPGRDDPSRLELLKIEELSQDPISLRTPNGEARTASLKDIMFWNVGMRDSERKVIAKFFDSGGQGRIVSVAAPADLSQSKYQGFYLIAEKLPTGEGKGLIADSNAVPMLQHLLDQGVTIAFTDEWKRIQAAVGGKSSPLGIMARSEGETVIVVTPTTDASVIAHEARHLQDRKEEITTRVIDEFKARYPNGEVGLTPVQLKVLFQFINEQRAYAAQMQFLRENAIDAVSHKLFLSKKAYHLDVLRESYVIPIQGPLDELKKADLPKWGFLREMVKKYSLASEDVPASLLFP